MDQLLAGEVADPGPGREHLDACRECGERFAAIEAERAAFRRAAPPLALPSAPGRRRAWMWPAAGATAAALAAAAVVLAATVPARNDGDASAIRRKGSARLGFFVEHRGAVREGGPGEVVFPGDSLRFTYATDRPAHVAVLSVDGADHVTIYVPRGSVAERVEPGSNLALPGSTILDDTLGAETVYGLFCDRPVELEPVRAAFAASPRHPPIPDGCEVDRLAIEKRPLP